MGRSVFAVKEALLLAAGVVEGLGMLNFVHEIVHRRANQVHVQFFWTVVHGTAVRNRLAVRIAGSHPADRGSIPRYGSNHMVFSLKMADLRFLCQKHFLSNISPSIFFSLFED